MDKEQLQNLEIEEEEDDSSHDYAFIAINKRELSNKLNLLRVSLIDGQNYLIEELSKSKHILSEIENCIKEEISIYDQLEQCTDNIYAIQEFYRLIDNLKISIELLEDITK